MCELYGFVQSSALVMGGQKAELKLKVPMEKEGKICSSSEYSDLDWASVCGTGWGISTSEELMLYILKGVLPGLGGLCCNNNSPSANCRVLQSKAGGKKEPKTQWQNSSWFARQRKLFLWKGAAICCPAFPACGPSFTFSASHIMVLYSLKVLILFCSCSPKFKLLSWNLNLTFKKQAEVSACDLKGWGGREVKKYHCCLSKDTFRNT